MKFPKLLLLTYILSKAASPKILKPERNLKFTKRKVGIELEFSFFPYVYQELF